MPTNIPLDDETVRLLSGRSVTLGTNLSDQRIEHPVLGEIGFDEIHATITPMGIFVGFELDPEEIEAIKRGNNKFMIQFIEPSGVSPFIFLFEREIPDVELGRVQEIDRLKTELSE